MMASCVKSLRQPHRHAGPARACALFVIDSQRIIRFCKEYPDALNPGVDELLSVLESLAQEREDLDDSP